MRILLMNMSPKNYGATQEILKTMQEAAPKGASTDPGLRDKRRHGAPAP